MLIKILLLFTIVTVCNLEAAQAHSAPLYCPKNLVPITGFAKAFVGEQRIKKAKIELLGLDSHIITDNNGRFSFCASPGKFITLTLTKNSQLPWDDYKATQIGSFLVAPQGFQGTHNELTFQVPRKITFALLKEIISNQKRIVLDPSACQVATTITAFRKTLYDDIQGEAGAQIIVIHKGKIIKNITPLYFGILLNKTNPFDLSQDHSSADGGVVITNLPASKIPYQITAQKKGKLFTREYFYCQPGAFINLSPPHGVNVIN